MTMVEKAYDAAGADASLPAVQAEVLEYISNLRFGDDDLSYIWVHYYNPEDVEQTTMLMHPTLPELDGTDISDYQDMERFDSIYFNGEIYPNDDPRLGVIEKTNLFVAMNKTCRDHGGGIVKYYWPKPIPGGATKEGHKKMSYAEEFKPWNWVIGTGAYVDYIDQIVAAELARARVQQHGILITTLVAMFVALIIGLPISFWIGGMLTGVYRQLEEQLKRNEMISRELAERNADLESALAEVKTLSGLLPICSYCKQIRDDEGYWNQMEAYIGERSDAQFSHGICPKCAKEHYPEFKLYADDVSVEGKKG